MNRIGSMEIIFNRIKYLHPMWVKGNQRYKDRMVKTLETDFVKLERLGVPRHFSEALLFFGKDFVDSLHEDTRVRDLELMFGRKSTRSLDHEETAKKIAEREGIDSYTIIITDGKVGIKRSP